LIRRVAPTVYHRTMRNLGRALWPVAVGTVIACGAGNTAQQILKAPGYNPTDQTKCHAGASSTQPLVVEWPSAARGDLEAIVETHKTVAVVRYVGCTMTVLSDCTAPGKVTYVPYRNGKQDQLRITNADDLYANLPVGAAGLEGKLSRAGELDVDMMLVGQYETDTMAVTQADLKGTCDGATHIVKRVTVGAFDFHTGASANVGGGVHVMGAGAGASSSASQDDIARDGKVDSCSAAKVDDHDPPPNCGALVRLEVVPLGGLAAPAPTAGLSRVATDASGCPAGMAAVAGGAFMVVNDAVPVQATCIDTTEVTADAYGACVRAGKCTAEGVACGPAATYGASGKENHPINCVDWSQAATYCQAQRKRLPRQEEWEWAARGGSEGRTYPWGDEIPVGQLCWSGASKREGTCPVGSFPQGDSLSGLHDLAGNVAEWTATGSNERGANRGGSWSDSSAGVVSGKGYTSYSFADPTAHRETLGFRCAVAPAK
jgi:sulfatase modifying factor 1